MRSEHSACAGPRNWIAIAALERATDRQGRELAAAAIGLDVVIQLLVGVEIDL